MRCRLIINRGLARFLDKFFGLFDGGINTCGDEALADEPFLVNNGVSADEDCISFVDVFGREVSFDTNGAVGLNLDVITQLRGGSFKVFYRHVGVDDSGGAGRNREDERGLALVSHSAHLST